MKGHIRRRGQRSWAIVIELERGPDGKRRQKWHTVNGPRKEAETKLGELLHAVNSGTYVEPSKLTVGEFFDRWLTDYAKRQVSGKTYERYESIVRHHIKPALGNHILTQLQPLHLESTYTKWLATGRKKQQHSGNPGLSARTVLQHHRVLHRALAVAVRWGLIVRNPADAVDPPSYDQKETQALDETHTAWLVACAQGGRLCAPALFAAGAGLRRGEILALRWADLNLDTGFVMVRRSLEQTRDGMKFKETKGKQARALPLPALLTETLRIHQHEQKKQQELLGPAYEDNDLVFPDVNGSLWRPDNFTSAFVALAARAGLKGVRFHDLRHSHASQLLRHGVHPKVVQERLGHSGIAITLDIYSHLLPGIQDEAVQKLDGSLRAAIRKLDGTRRQ